jgi:phosphoglycolate phosphatase-like HAD superfamily hydrolase
MSSHPSQYWNPPSTITKDTPISTLVLFDIDGTLLEGGFLHKLAFEEALRQVYGMDHHFDWPNFQGRTDSWIVRHLAMKNGISETVAEARANDVLDALANYYVSQRHQITGHVHPGVREYLASLDQRGILRGLVTGNVEPIAYYKLMHFNLEKGFALGAFGSDHIDRSDLLRLAIQRAENHFNFHYNGKNVIYIADTPLDMDATHRAGLPGVAVLTGVHNHSDFNAVNPELILSNLSEWPRIDQYLARL